MQGFQLPTFSHKRFLLCVEGQECDACFFDKRSAAIRCMQLERRRQWAMRGIGHLVRPIPEEDHGRGSVHDCSGSPLPADARDRDSDQAGVARPCHLPLAARGQMWP